MGIRVIKTFDYSTIPIYSFRQQELEMLISTDRNYFSVHRRTNVYRSTSKLRLLLEQIESL